MKFFCLILFILVFCACSHADEFLGAPVMNGGQLIRKTDSYLEKEYPKTYKDMISYYEEAFKSIPDIKYRNYRKATDIADLGKQPWDSIEISVVDEGHTKVVISKNRWIWTLKNLVFPFVGVFVVLSVLYLATFVSGVIFSRAANRR